MNEIGITSWFPGQEDFFRRKKMERVEKGEMR